MNWLHRQWKNLSVQTATQRLAPQGASRLQGRKNGGKEVVLEAGFSKSRLKHSLGCKTLTKGQPLGRGRRCGGVQPELNLSQVWRVARQSIPHQANTVRHLIPHSLGHQMWVVWKGTTSSKADPAVADSWRLAACPAIGQQVLP